MKTAEILLVIEEIIVKEFKDSFPITYDFEIWEKSYSKLKDKIYEIIHQEYNIEIKNIKNDALMIIMNKIFIASLNNGEQKWDREYVRQKYEKKIAGCDVLYFPAKNAKRLVVNFSSMGKDRYDRYSRYWDSTERWDNETAYVFFKDDNNTYYIGNDENPLSGRYFRFIKNFYHMNQLAKENVFTVGGSMGGYAAIYYAVLLKLNGAIVVGPQTTYRATLAHEYKNWKKHIRALGGEWVDLDMMVHRVKKCPNIYIEYGHYVADVLAVDSFLEEVRKKQESFVIVRKTNWSEHTVDSCLSKETVDNMIWLFENHGFVFDSTSIFTS